MYRRIRDMNGDAPVPWKRFFVVLGGKTNGAHGQLVSKLKGIGHREVTSVEESEYILLFCPVVSRVGTDIGEALETVEDGKPVALVVMHHTFNKDLIIAESRRQVDNRNVVLTVDYLFHNNKPLQCNRNDIAWGEVQKFFGVSPWQPPYVGGFYSWLKENPKLVIFVGVCLTVAVVVFTLVFVLEERKN